MVSGAAGFTGAHFCAMATAAGHVVVPLQANLLEPEALKNEVQSAEFESVVHLAAISFAVHQDEAALYGVNTVGSMNLLRALSAKTATPTRIVLASSAAVYGASGADGVPVAEETATAPNSHYGASKAAMEQLAHAMFPHLPIIIARPFNYTGAGQAGQFIIPKLVSHFASRAPTISLGNIHVAREFNDVRDVCSAYLGLLQFGEIGQCYNLCSGTPHALANVISTLTALTGHTLKIEVNPAFVRSNDPARLSGNPAKLHALCAANGAAHPARTLDETLRSMLDAA